MLQPMNKHKNSISPSIRLVLSTTTFLNSAPLQLSLGERVENEEEFYVSKFSGFYLDITCLLALG